MKNKIRVCIVCGETKLIRAKDMCPECYRREYYKTNLERIKETYLIYHEKNKEKIKQWNKQYYEDNKKEYLRKSTERSKYRRQRDINYKLRINISSRIRSVITKGYKNASTLELLGCSVNFIRQHLESQFTEGMTWDNYGEWHVDHIIPCAAFNLEILEEQKKCFNYKNLQPLWGKDNLSKGARLDYQKDIQESKLKELGLI